MVARIGRVCEQDVEVRCLRTRDLVVKVFSPVIDEGKAQGPKQRDHAAVTVVGIIDAHRCFCLAQR